LGSRAFATIIKNRVNRGGILANGASFIKNGENGKGITSRWYPETLRRRILEIAQVKHKIDFIEGDAFEICEKNASREDVVYFIDSPYRAAGQRLYRYSEINHEALFDLAHRLQGNFLMTYDNASDVQAMASCCKFETKLIAMKNTHHTKKTELIIGKDLTWLKNYWLFSCPSYQNLLYHFFLLDHSTKLPQTLPNLLSRCFLARKTHIAHRSQLYFSCIQEYIFCRKSKLPEFEALTHKSPSQALKIEDEYTKEYVTTHNTDRDKVSSD
jgi:hypothetical protein